MTALISMYKQKSEPHSEIPFLTDINGAAKTST